MSEPHMLETPSGRRIAYYQTPGSGPGVVFLGGFSSDMTGTKALHLEAWAKREGRAFLRFDYSGHGASSGTFEDGTIGAWAEDARAAILGLTEGPQILVGSSMGGWIALLLTKKIPERICGLVGIAAAPDFTADSMWASFSDEQKEELDKEGKIRVPSDYSDEGYVITRDLIYDGWENLVLRSRLLLPFPTRFLQGTADEDVPVSVALRLLEHATGLDIRLALVKGADHRFSGPDELALIETAIAEVTVASMA